MTFRHHNASIYFVDLLAVDSRDPHQSFHCFYRTRITIFFNVNLSFVERMEQNVWKKKQCSRMIVVCGNHFRSGSILLHFCRVLQIVIRLSKVFRVNLCST